MDLLGELVVTPRGFKYILVIVDRITKLTHAIPLRSKSALDIAKAFASHWVFKYGIPKTILTDNGSDIAGQFMTEFHQILGCKSLTTTTYHPQTNGQTERFNRTLLAALRTYVGDHPTDWDLYAETFTYAYNSQPHSTTGQRPFDLVLTRPPGTLAVEDPRQTPHTDEPLSRSAWLRDFQVRLREARAQLGRNQARYKRNFDAALRNRRKSIDPRGYVFLRVDKTSAPIGMRHKLAPVATGPFKVAEVKAKTAVILVPNRQSGNLDKEEVSLDRLEPAPKPPDVPAQTPGPPGPKPTLAEGQELIVRDIVAHRQILGAPTGYFEYYVRWLNFPVVGDTSWEPIQHLRHRQIMRYCRKKRLPLPPNIDHARAG